MSLAYEECLIPASGGEVLGELRRSISEVGWEIAEESASSFFCLERRRSFLRRLLRTPTRFSLSVEDFEKWTKVRLVFWPRGWAGSETAWAVREVLNSRPPLSPAPDEEDDGTSPRAPVDTYSALNVEPSWFKRARLGWGAWYLLVVAGYFALFALDDMWPYGLAFGLPLIWIACISAPVVFDLVPRRFLRIRSRRGLEEIALMSTISAIILTPICVLFAYPWT